MVKIAVDLKGEPTDNFQEMYDWLMDEKRKKDMLEGCFFAIFGLGNRTYEYFNAIGTRVDKRLAELGCDRLHTVGMGDDNRSVFLQRRTPVWMGFAKLCQKMICHDVRQGPLPKQIFSTIFIFEILFLETCAPLQTQVRRC